ncbi:MAG: ABC transporter permease [Terriglobales bacterium]
MRGLGDDWRATRRALRKHPVLSAAVIVCLALGIGANTAIFSLIDALLLRPAQVAGRQDLVEVWGWQPRQDPFGGASSLTFPDFAYYRAHNHVFTGLSAFAGDVTSVVWSHGGEGEAIQGQFVTANFFSVLGVRPVLGRGFLPAADDLNSSARGIVLSNAFWRRRFAADPKALGRAMVIDGEPLTIVGVAPPRFTGAMILFAPDFWAAPAAMARLEPDIQRRTTSYHSFWLFAIGRLRAGVSPAQAQAELRVLAKQTGPRHGQHMADFSAVVFPAQLTPRPVRGWVELFAGGALVLTLLVLLIACANAANLLLAQSLERRREMAVRSALGASRARLIRMALADSVALSLLGALAGLLLAWRLAPLVLRLKPESFPLSLDLGLDWRVLGFTLAAGILTGVAAGLGPALRASRPGALRNLKDGAAVGGTRRSRTAAALVVVQIATCLVLLVGAGLCVRSLYNARTINPGFNPDRVLTGGLDLRAAGYSSSQRLALLPRLQAQIESLPGVVSASFADMLPLQPSVNAGSFTINGHTVNVQYYHVAPRYFATMRTPLEAGREFTAADGSQAPSVAIVNHAFAQRYWPGRGAIGRQIALPGKPPTALTVVGVAATGKYQTLSEPPRPVMFMPLAQGFTERVVLVARTAFARPDALLPALRRRLLAVNPNLALIQPQTMNQAMAWPLFTARLAGTLFAVFGGLALLLAAIGLYAMFAFAVARRRREVGVRMALGASGGRVLRLLLGEALRLYSLGAAIGLAIAFFAARVLAALLYGISPRDPLTFAAVAIFLGAIALLASYLPARQAARLSPLAALREE